MKPNYKQMLAVANKGIKEQMERISQLEIALDDEKDTSSLLRNRLDVSNRHLAEEKAEVSKLKDLVIKLVEKYEA